MANDVTIGIGADSSGAVKGIQEVQTGFGKMSSSFEKHRKKIAIGMTALGGGLVALAATQMKSAQAEAIGIAKLDQALKNVGGSYAATSVAIEKQIAATQRSTNFGDEVQREVLVQLVTVLGDEKKALEALPAVLDASAKSGKSTTTVAESMGRALAGLTNNATSAGVSFEKTEEFGDRLAKVMSAVGGQAEAAADPMTQLKNSTGDLQQEFGKALLPALEAIVPPMTELITKIIAWTQENPKLTTAITIIAAGIGGLALVLGPILLILPGITAAVGLLSAAFGVLSLSMGPVTLVILGVTAAIVAGILIWKNWDKIILLLKATFDKVMNFIQTIVEKVFGAITAAYESKLGWLLPGGALVTGILWLMKNWREVFESIQTVTKNVTGAVSGFFVGMKDKILGVWDGIVGGIRDAINWIVDKINAFIGSWNRIQLRVPRVRLPEILGGYTVGGQVFGVPQLGSIPRLANGGIVRRPTLAMIGESGPEAVVPLNKGGAGINVNITVNGDIITEDFEQRVTAAVRDSVLGGGFSGILARA